MTVRARQRWWVAVLLGARVLGALQCQDFNMLDTQQEVAIGRQVAAQVERKTVMCPDPAVQQYVRFVGANLVRVCDRHDVTYHFVVIQNHKQVNAFAAPGGFIYIYTGLLRAAGTSPRPPRWPSTADDAPARGRGCPPCLGTG